MTPPAESAPSRLSGFMRWLNPRRLGAQAIVVAVCLWSFLVDFATPGLFDRAGNIKFQDFLPVYISARLIAQHRSSKLYDQSLQQYEVEQIVGHSTPGACPVFLWTASRFAVRSYCDAFISCGGVSLGGCEPRLLFLCVYVLWKRCFPTSCGPRRAGMALHYRISAALSHFFVRTKLSVLSLRLFYGDMASFCSRKPLLAGVALGLLAFNRNSWLRFRSCSPCALLDRATAASFFPLRHN